MRIFAFITVMLLTTACADTPPGERSMADRIFGAMGAFGAAVNNPQAQAQQQQDALRQAQAAENARAAAEARRPVTCINMGGGIISCR